MTPSWLTARPVAHRGLHDASAGIIENTASSVRAAIAGNYAIEVDLQASADGETMVHHDDALGRLTEGEGRLDAFTASALKQARFRATADRMMTLSDLCALVAGRVALVIELKSHFDGDPRLVKRAVAVLREYSGPAALMSFDPEQVQLVKELAARIPRGLVAESWRRSRSKDQGELAGSDPLRLLRQGIASRPDFLAYSVRDLPGALPFLTKNILGMPLLTWTVRSDADRARAARHADQMIFEGFHP